ncbi:hypothetical protein FA10DRAFT_262167 [Acaromyces ingoldii]|uniref:Uncharacterized protein n=1 Tax=Acaromyces ingoldii TaxID=215250 RepID=A0A316YIY9_9BASI|nr:hypothetical protein FA10DRAFT_262167 [Acaromyces ingoldii]PWN87685.1 hypothetical protein FA10DRAFT_262167 [Acaromyces ingoldii]
MLPLHFLTACLFFLVAQVAGDERHLIFINKVSIGNLAALEILMRRGGYTHAHIILNGIRHFNKAVGHFDHWIDAFGRQRSPDTSPAFTTYKGRSLPDDHPGEWYESSFLGTPREPGKKSLYEMKFLRGVIYDIHQVVSTSPRDHQWIYDQIIAKDAYIGRVFVQHGPNTQIYDNLGLSRSFHIELERIYRTARRILIVCTNSIEPAEISVSLSELNYRLPYEHLYKASKDPFAANTLIRVNNVLNGEKAELEFLPENLRKVERDENTSFVEAVRRLVREGLNGRDVNLKASLNSWVPEARKTVKNEMKKSQDDYQRAYLGTLLQRLDAIVLKLKNGQPREGEVAFADPMLTVVLFSNKYKPQPFPRQEQGEASSSSSSGCRGSRVCNAELGQKQKVAGTEAMTYKNLPRQELLDEVLKHFPENDKLGSYTWAFPGDHTSPYPN